MGNVEPQMQYVRLKKEGVGFWFKGQVTEAFPPEDSVAANHPWKIVNMTGVGTPNQNGDYSSYEFSVWPGVINGIMPPNLFDGGELAKFTAGASVQNVILKCTSDGKGITAATVEVSGTVPSPKPAVKFGLPNELNILLAVVYKSSVYQIESTSLQATPYTVGIAEKNNVTDGQYPYDVFLNWQYHQAASGGSFGGGNYWDY